MFEIDSGVIYLSGLAFVSRKTSVCDSCVHRSLWLRLTHLPALTVTIQNFNAIFKTPASRSMQPEKQMFKI